MLTQIEPPTHKKSSESATSISLVLPAWNEAEALPRAIAEADAALRGLCSRYEIIVVDDGSHDSTAEVVSQIAAANPAVKLLRHQQNRGYGAALRTGFAAASCDLVAFTDADNQFDLRELDRFALLSKDYEIVCGYRIDRKDSALRCLYSRVYNSIVRVLLRTGVRDVDCALKLFHRETIEQFTITGDGFLVNSELLFQAHQQGCSIVEVGVSHRPRVEGQSTVSIWHIPTVLAAILRFWWNRVQFSGSDLEKSESETPPLAHRHDAWGKWHALVLLIAAMLLLTGLSYPLIDRDETRYGEIPREMVATGDYVVPQLNFHPYFDKPVLLYWLCAASYTLFGVSEWAARLVPAGCGLLTLIATMWFASRHWGSRVGLLSGIVLLLSVGFLGASRVLLTDGLLMCCVTLSMLAAYEAIVSGKLRYGWWSLAAVACGLGFLAKGPVSLVLFVPPLVAFTWLTTGVARLKILHWLLLVGVVLSITVPWFVAVSLQHPHFVYEFFYTHNVSRFGGAFHARPIWYYLPILLIAGHPWSFLGMGFIGFVSSRQKAICQQRPPLMGYLLLWSGWCVVFFSMSQCKLPPYILPAAVPLAMLMGRYLEHMLFSRHESFTLAQARNWAPWLATGTTCIVGIGFAVVGLCTQFESSTAAWTMIFIWSSILVGVLIAKFQKTSPLAGWSLCTGTALVLAVVVLHREMPRYAYAQTLFGENTPLLAEIPDAHRLPIITIGHEWAGVPFDTRRDDIYNVPLLNDDALPPADETADRVLVVTRNKQPLDKSTLPEWLRVTKVVHRGPAILMVMEVNHELAMHATKRSSSAEGVRRPNMGTASRQATQNPQR